MPTAYTLQDLHRMSWQEFETTAVDAVRRLYSRYDIKISETPYSQDGGRDGEAQHVLAVGLGPDLAISIKVFLEIKKRQNENVGKSDIGSHLIDAFANRATKIIFITNREFAEPLARWLENFCGPLNIQFSLVSGKRLLEWLNAPPSVSRRRSQAPKRANSSRNGQGRGIQGRLTFTLDPNEAMGGMAICTVRSDRPIFALLDLRVGEQVPPFDSFVDVVPLEKQDAIVHRLGGDNATLFSPGDLQRCMFAIWPERSGRWDASCFQIALRDSDISLSVESTNGFRVPEQALGVALASSQESVETALKRSLERWRTLGGICPRFLMAAGGLGKSFIVGRLRREWHALRLRELVLDGETVTDDAKLIERTFSALFPFPKDPFDQSAKPALARWLATLNLTSEACEALATDLCRPSGLQPSRYSLSVRAEVFAAMLTEASSSCGLVFVLEDLHKVSPSVISILEEALSLLRGRGRGDVFLLLTSRFVRETGDHNITADWLARLQGLSALADDAVDYISPLQSRMRATFSRGPCPAWQTYMSGK